MSVQRSESLPRAERAAFRDHRAPAGTVRPRGGLRGRAGAAHDRPHPRQPALAGRAHGRHFLAQLGNAVVSFALRGERQPWGAEDTAFVFRETFKAAPTDSQRADEAILTYARKRPVVKAR